MNFDTNLDWEEAFMYRPGQKVELKTQPGTFDVIASYDPMMVPPIWLANDSRPRYAHELRVVQTTNAIGGRVVKLVQRGHKSLAGKIALKR